MNTQRNERLLRSVQRMAEALARLERSAASEHGVSISQQRTLLRLARTESVGARVSDLAVEEGIAVSTMTRNIALLERKGLVEKRGAQHDRRAVEIRLTPEGEQLASRLGTQTEAQLSSAFGTFHPTDRVERAVAIERVATAIESVITKRA